MQVASSTVRGNKVYGASLDGFCLDRRVFDVSRLHAPTHARTQALTCTHTSFKLHTHAPTYTPTHPRTHSFVTHTHTQFEDDAIAPFYTLAHILITEINDTADTATY